MATTSPRRTPRSMPRSTSVPFKAVYKPRALTTALSLMVHRHQPTFEPACQAGQGIAERQVEESAEKSRRQPAAHVDCSDRHLLGQFNNRDHGYQRRILEQRDEIVG